MQIRTSHVIGPSSGLPGACLFQSLEALGIFGGIQSGEPKVNSNRHDLNLLGGRNFRALTKFCWCGEVSPNWRPAPCESSFKTYRIHHRSDTSASVYTICADAPNGRGLVKIGHRPNCPSQMLSVTTGRYGSRP